MHACLLRQRMPGASVINTFTRKSCVTRRRQYVDPTVKLRAGQLRKYRAMANLTKDTDLADRMGVHRSTVIRTISGDAVLSGRFIAALITIFHPLTFDDLFEICPPLAIEQEHEHAGAA